MIFNREKLYISIILIFSLGLNYINEKKKNAFHERYKELINYENNLFVIITVECDSCGILWFFKNYLGCSMFWIEKGYIPIIDLNSFPNIFNKYNKSFSNINPWELYFNQPFGYSLNEVKKNAKNLTKVICKNYNLPNYTIYNNYVSMEYWHNMAKKYIPIKRNILEEAEKIRFNLFKSSKDILGVLIRGTDYIKLKPGGHYIPPTPEIIFKDITNFEKLHHYSYIFVTTEDNEIRKKFIDKFKKRIKYFAPLFYNVSSEKLIAHNKDIIQNNLKYMKIYLINIILLSKCRDIIVSRTSGSIGAFILTDGFRYNKVYNLGLY